MAAKSPPKTAHNEYVLARWMPLIVLTCISVVFNSHDDVSPGRGFWMKDRVYTNLAGVAHHELCYAGDFYHLDFQSRDRLLMALLNRHYIGHAVTHRISPAAGDAQLKEKAVRDPHKRPAPMASADSLRILRELQSRPENKVRCLEPAGPVAALACKPCSLLQPVTPRRT